MKQALKLLNISFWCTVVLVLPVGNADAGTILCGSAQRTMELSNVDACYTGAGNIGGSPADLALIASYYPTGPWSLEGDPVGASSGGDLTISLATGSFGASASGTWAIDPGFWVDFGAAVITAHVGNGPATVTPDHWAFLVTPGALSGTWDYNKISGGGGGLSNFKLFGSGTGSTSVPESGILSLLSIGLLGLGLSRRRLKS